MILAQRLGDTKTHSVKLKWGNVSFAPADEWFLVFTVKTDAETVLDASSLFQKTTDVGITVSGSTAFIEVERADTKREEDTPEEGDPAFEATPGTYDWDIQAQNIADPAVIRTVANGTFTLKRDVTRGVETAVPVYVAAPGVTYDTQIVTYL